MMFEVGKEYRTRGMGSYRMIHAEGEVVWGVISSRAPAYTWDRRTGKAIGLARDDDGYDLLPPEPEIVVSDAVLAAYEATPGSRSAALAAAIAQYLRENPR